jgi:hypothetical protein
MANSVSIVKNEIMVEDINKIKSKKKKQIKRKFKIKIIKNL